MAEAKIEIDVVDLTHCLVLLGVEYCYENKGFAGSGILWYTFQVCFRMVGSVALISVHP
jgi:hypothetical protein